MKNILILLILVFFSPSVFSQSSTKNREFLDRLSVILTNELNKVKADSQSFSGFYSFRLRNSDSLQFSVEGSRSMPNAVKKALVTSLAITFKEGIIPDLLPDIEKYYLIPMFLDYTETSKSKTIFPNNSFYSIVTFDDDKGKPLPTYLILGVFVIQSEIHNGYRKVKELNIRH